jgi:adenosylhomocysteinase
MIKKTHPAFLQYFNKYSKTDAPFMHRQLHEWSRTKPLANMRVLHHLPLVPNTLLKIAIVSRVTLYALPPR